MTFKKQYFLLIFFYKCEVVHEKQTKISTWVSSESSLKPLLVFPIVAKNKELHMKVFILLIKCTEVYSVIFLVS